MRVHKLLRPSLCKALRRGFSGSDHHELPIDFGGKPIVKIPYSDNRFLSILGFHNTIKGDEITGGLISTQGKSPDRRARRAAPIRQSEPRRKGHYFRQSSLSEAVQGPGGLCPGCRRCSDCAPRVPLRRRRRKLTSRWIRGRTTIPPSSSTS